ncbi:MAG: hypothetical protein IPL88_13410 [Rhizobiales bacterium]|nr:hypothetical protein [Hyphomicrobiales bacterium]
MSGSVRNPSVFWSFVCAARASIEMRLGGLSEPSYADIVARCPDLIAALAAYDPLLTPEIRHYEEAVEFVVSADSAPECFASAQDLVAAAPVVPGWRVRALRPRRDVPRFIEDNGVRLDTSRLRVAYGLANDRMVAMLLIEDDLPGDYFEAQYLARRIVADMLGEEDFANWMADARMLRYEDWLAISPGGRSWPLAELPARFDDIFHRRQRPVDYEALALSA